MTYAKAPRITHSKAVDKFLIDNRQWLNNDHGPAVASLLDLAEIIDGGEASAQDRTIFGQTYRDLLNRKPVELVKRPEEQVSELARLLAETA